MPIIVSAPDGSDVEFPDGTPDAVIERAMRQAYGGPLEPPPMRPGAARGAVDGAGPGDATTVSEVTVTAPRLQERGRAGVDGGRLPIFQPWKDFSTPIARAWDELSSDVRRDFNSFGVDAETGIPKKGGGQVNVPELAGDLLGLPVAVAEGITRQATGPLSRLAVNAGLPVYERRSLVDQALNLDDPSIPKRLEGEAAADAVQGALELALGGARAVPRVGPPRPPIAAPTRVERRVGAAIRRAVERDQMTPAQVIDNLRADPELPAFQAGGENMRAMADVLTQAPGEANTMLRAAARDSQAKAPSRIRAEIGKTFNASGDYFSTVEEMKAARKAAAEPHRQAAFSAEIDQAAFDSEIAPLLARAPRSAMNYAVEIARRDGVDPNEIGLQVSPASGDIPEMVAIRRPTMQTLHYIKKGLDQELEQYRTPLGTLDTEGNPLAGSTAKLRSEYGQALRRVNGDYDAYMRVWGDESGQIEALALGRDALTNRRGISAEQLRKRYGEMSQAEQDNYRLGLGEALFDQVNRKGVQAARQLLKNDEFQARVRIAVPDETSFNDFMSALERQVQIQDRNTSIAGGSPTAYRAAARADLEQQGMGPADIVIGAIDFTTGPLRTVTGKALKETLKAIPKKDHSVIGNPELNRALGAALSDPDEMTRLLNLIEIQRARRGQIASTAVKALPPLAATPETQGPPMRQ